MNATLVTDFIVRIKNAALARRKNVMFPYSRLCKEIGDVLVDERILEEVVEENKDNKKVLTATIRYIRRRPSFSDVKIVSKPSLRVYANISKLAQRRKRGSSCIIVSTSRGVMTAAQAVKSGLGGEVLFEVI